MAEHESDKTRERILQAATELFASRGFHGTSIRAICEQARTNVAAVNYHFRSKERLYVEVFRHLFEGFRKPLLAMPDRVHDAASWKQALKEWVEYTLRVSTNNEPPDCWVTQLVAHERTDPTSAMPILHKQLFEPMKMAIERIVRMGLPQGSTDLDVHLATISLMAQCTVYHHRKPPWEKLLIPPGVDRAAWIARTAQFIVEGITSRFSFRTTKV
jgi:AcrR family transcriptional regulator